MVEEVYVCTLSIWSPELQINVFLISCKLVTALIKYLFGGSELKI